MDVSNSFILLALIFYTVSVWSEKIFKKITTIIVVIFSFGFGCDLVGTFLMRFKAHHDSLTFHQTCGYLALGIMFVHLLWAIAALLKTGKAAYWFSKFSVWAWTIWLIAFVSGVPWLKIL